MKKGFIDLSTGTRKLVLVMIIITLVGVFIANRYYSHINNIDDPRIYHVKQLHLKYNQAVNDNNKDLAISLLDSMDSEFSRLDHYRKSFERGVLSTDKAAIYINSAIYGQLNEDDKILLLNKAEKELKISLKYYDKWNYEFSAMNDQELKERIAKDFDEIESDYKKEIIENRVANIKTALNQIDKRFSVTYTNLGIVMRHKLLQDSAIVFYKKALDLWEDNHTAKSNLSVLMGGEPIKRGVVEKLFPPEKDDD